MTELGKITVNNCFIMQNGLPLGSYLVKIRDILKYQLL